MLPSQFDPKLGEVRETLFGWKLIHPNGSVEKFSSRDALGSRLDEITRVHAGFVPDDRKDVLDDCRDCRDVREDVCGDPEPDDADSPAPPPPSPGCRAPRPDVIVIDDPEVVEDDYVAEGSFAPPPPPPRRRVPVDRVLAMPTRSLNGDERFARYDRSCTDPERAHRRPRGDVRPGPKAFGLDGA